MFEQFRWLWMATVSMFWTPTTLLGRPTSVFARRLIVHSLFIGLAVIVIGLAALLSGKTELLPTFGLMLLLTPFGAAINIYGYTLGFQAVMRVFGVCTSIIPFFGILGRIFIWGGDLLWRIEAGPAIAADQRQASKMGLARAQVDEWMAVLPREVRFGRIELAQDVVLWRGSDRRGYDSVEIRQGEVYGRYEGQEEKFATVRDTGSRFDLVATLPWRCEVTFDYEGRAPGGEFAVRHPQLTNETWDKVAAVDVPVHEASAPVSGGRGVAAKHSAVAVLLIFLNFAVVWGLAAVASGIAGFFPEDEVAATEAAPSPTPVTDAVGAGVAGAAEEPGQPELAYTGLIASTVAPDQLAVGPLRCALEQHGTARGSSVFAKGKEVHPAEFAADDNGVAPLTTAWCEGAAGNGEGEWVEVETCCAVPGAPIVLRVAPGYQKKMSTWKANNRVSEAQVSVRSGTFSWAGPVRFEDSMTEQFVVIPGAVCSGATVTARVTIASVVPSLKGEDTCVSDLALLVVGPLAPLTAAYAAMHIATPPVVTVHSLDPVALPVATALDDSGAPLAVQPMFTWTVAPETVARLEGNHVIPVANGEAFVEAAAGTGRVSYRIVVALADEEVVAVPVEAPAASPFDDDEELDIPATAGKSDNQTAATSKPEKAPERERKCSLAGGPVNINRADSGGLGRLPGVGERQADAIIGYRKRVGPFTSCDDLVRLSSITASSLVRILPCCTVK